MANHAGSARKITDTQDSLKSPTNSPDYMLSLARGLRVIESFEGNQDGRTIVELGRSTGLSRAAIRRILITLESLGYVERSRQVYRLRTQVLRLGYSFLSSSSVVEAARPVLERITEKIHESSSMSMLDGGDIVYVARCSASRVMAAGLSVGSRLPAYCTSMGRVLLGSLPLQDLDTYLTSLKPTAYTKKTITSIPKLKRIILRAGKEGFSVVDEELEAGLRSIAVPVVTRNNLTVAAINVGTHTSRIGYPEIIKRCLPVLQEGAQTLRAVLL